MTRLRKRETLRAAAQPRLGLGGDLAGESSLSRNAVGAPAEVPAIPELEPKSSWRQRVVKSRRRLLNDEHPQATWTNGSRVGTQALTVLVLAALASGPISLGWQYLHPVAPQVEASGSIDERLLSRRSVASETAAQWVQAWLTTPEDRAGELRATYAGQVALPKVAAKVSGVRVLDAVASDVGVWSVKVAADVAPAGAKTAVRRYFQVPIAVAGDTGDVAASPMTPPAPIPPPGATTFDAGSYGTQVLSNGPLGQTVTAFLIEGLAGGDITRYVTPGQGLPQLVEPSAAYSTAKVTDIKADRDAPGSARADTPPDGAQVRVLATVELHERGEQPGAQGLTATYPLSLTARGGRWEVTGIDTSLAHTERDNGSQNSRDGETP